ncbi:MAG: hypothetical protein ACXADY_07330 [Candidatus Hodarchaeales archaeon]|jgi:hypothetical protein
MAERQRKKEKEKKKAKPVDVLGTVFDEVTKETSLSKSTDLKQISADVSRSAATASSSQREPVLATHTPPVSSTTTITEPSPTTKLQPGKVDPRVKPVLPAWVGKPWRWMVPDDPQLKQQWLMTWGEFMLDFARVLNFHILDLQEVALVYPFKNPMLRKKLTHPQIVMISEYLIEIEKAKWWDSEQTRLRVYWKTLKSHADELFQYAFQNGYDMVTAFDIVKMKQSWSSLPPQDIRMIMKIMVESKRASWSDSERKTIDFRYD